MIIVTVRPYARSPYFRIRLYTPTCSSVFTIASGVQGRIDFTYPGGGSSVSRSACSELAEVDEDEGGREERRDVGWMKRMLERRERW